MKKILFIVLCLFVCAPLINATSKTTPDTDMKEVFYKMGKVSQTELLHNDYAMDVSDADAVVLYELKDILLYFNNCYDANYGKVADYLIADNKISRKIKILNFDGLRYANVTLQYDFRDKPINHNTQIYDIEAYSYTMENGKMHKTKLLYKDIEIKQLNDSVAQVKFTIPNVQVGSIIEYKYCEWHTSLKSFAFDVNMQYDIPVLDSYCQVSRRSHFLSDVTDKFFIVEHYGSHPLIKKEGEYRKTVEAAKTRMTPSTREPHTLRGAKVKYVGRGIGSMYCDMTIYNAKNIPTLTTDATGVHIELHQNEGVYMITKPYNNFN